MGTMAGTAVGPHYLSVGSATSPMWSRAEGHDMALCRRELCLRCRPYGSFESFAVFGFSRKPREQTGRTIMAEYAIPVRDCGLCSLSVRTVRDHSGRS